MNDTPRLRFAPSPTGWLHIGNARTALFNFLLARKLGGKLILRIEDTDRARSLPEYEAGLMADLRWLGIQWDEGEDVGGNCGPYRQSARAERHAAGLQKLAESGAVYPCTCTPERLEMVRQQQLAKGQPPRYDGHCRPQDGSVVAPPEGTPFVWRFRVPEGERFSFEDLVLGTQTMQAAHMGDFALSRSDGTVTFLGSSLMDDLDMGVTHVLRGVDHVTNTFRQRLIAQALGQEPPAYGHLPLVNAPGGKPLSKRDGGASVRDFRQAGYLPETILNAMVRLGWTPPEGAKTLEELAEAFDPAAIQPAPAVWDVAHLPGLSREALQASTGERLSEAARALDPALDFPAAYWALVKGNLETLRDGLQWKRLRDPSAPVDDAEAQAVLDAVPEALLEAMRAIPVEPGQEGAWAKAVGQAAGLKGKELFMPLRAILSGALHGPSIGEIVAYLQMSGIRQRVP